MASVRHLHERDPDGPHGANLSVLRGHNAALLLSLLRDAGEDGVSRPELAERTGLTPQAVSKITARLRADGLAAEAGTRPSTGGKPRTVLRLVRGARSAVGLHLDRDELTAVRTDLTGEPLDIRVAPLDFGAGAEAVLDAAVAQVAAVLAPDRAVPTPDGAAARDQGADPVAGEEPAGERVGGGRVLGVGVASPGPLDHGAGVLRRVTGFPHWDGFPLRDALAARLGLPVVLDKDTNAAALGLARRPDGPEGSADSFAYLHLGTGLGAGLVLGGEVYRGARTDAGEFGHQVIQLDGPPCGCGGRGCVEALCLAAVAAGDPARAARLLGVGAANLVRLLDVDRVFLGGRTVLADPEPYARGVAAVLAAEAGRSGAGHAVAVDVAGRGRRLVAEGAAQLVLGRFFGRA
ncbi:ROK family transcriptional regulator [Streptomyces sp. LX-29]|uniref:ROK family transcriptional regulator n=1 Tax=Streptomyces sp. LX-29 TaxID=2900152 RepID=UPI00240E426C|nr:ROK family protein [Streptomyces sp. LX-29]WFB09285.1 ROK family transcriptional regulator [Streptomyces sp. LX-29]